MARAVLVPTSRDGRAFVYENQRCYPFEIKNGEQKTASIRLKDGDQSERIGIAVAYAQVKKTIILEEGVEL